MDQTALWSSDPIAQGRSDSAELEGHLLNLPNAVVHRRLGSLDWAFSGARGDNGLHGLVPFPAKFVPELPRVLIQSLSSARDVVVDPFVGSGTTHLEALNAGRGSIAIDASAWACLVTRVKSTYVSNGERSALRRYAREIAERSSADLASRKDAPDIPNVDKWYDRRTFELLTGIRARALTLSARARDIALLALGQAAMRASHQESETRYVSKPKAGDPEIVRLEVVRETLRVLDLVSGIPESWQGRGAVVLGDSRTELAKLAPASVGLIVTSPPYPNSFDYHLYQRFKLFWIGADPRELRSVEIGSHLRHQSHPNAGEAYASEMSAVLQGCWECLAPGRYAALVVGDGVYDGSTFHTAPMLSSVAADLGFHPLPPIERSLPTGRRAMAIGRRLEVEQLLLLYKPRVTTSVHVVVPNYRMQPYEIELSKLEIKGLVPGTPELEDWPTVEVEASSIDRLGQLGFAHGFETAAGRIHSSQYWLEGAHSNGSRKKNSTYLSHGLHDFKGKFYPQLARSLINGSGLGDDAVVFDPFSGSGTTAVEAVLLGHRAYSVDCNPLSAAITAAKLGCLRLDPQALSDSISIVVDNFAEPTPGERLAFGRANPKARRELVSWFPPKIIVKLDRLLGWIEEATDEPVREVLRIVVSDILRSVSQQEPKDLRIRRRKQPLHDADVLGRFESRARDLVAQMSAGWPTLSAARLGEATSITGDASLASAYEILDENKVAIDAVVTSPPYASALPYVDTDRLSLAGVFGIDSVARRVIEDQLVGSRELTVTTQREIRTAFEDQPADALPPSTVQFLRDYGAAVDNDGNAGFRLRGAPSVLIQYFVKMANVLGQLHRRMTPGGSCWIVVGDSRSKVGGAAWTIPTVTETASIALFQGFKLERILPIEVSRSDVLHSRHTITKNSIIHLTA